jgi:hypothetical protein
MKDSKFYTFLTALNTKELKKFRKYLESPYFNSHDKLFQLFEIFEAQLISTFRKRNSVERVVSG